MPPTTPTTPPPRHRYAVLATCCLSLFVVGLDNTIVNVALPSISRQFGAALADLQWTVDAYLVVLASLLVLSGATADRLGRRRVFQTGLVVFGTGSLLCGFAPGLGWLVAFRMLQAVGGSMLNPVAMSIITNTFVEPGERARAIGVWGAVSGVSLALGPVVGGLLVDTVGWRAIFWINVPVVLAAIALTARLVPESRAPRARRVDPVGQVLVIALLGSLTYGIIEGPRAGWGSPEIVGLFVLAALSLAGLLTYEPRRREPLIELGFFRSTPFASATLIAVLQFAAFGGTLFLNTLYLQQVRGLSALQAGVATLPLALASMLLAPVSGRLVASRGPRLPLAVAGVAGTAGMLLLTGLAPATPLALLLAAYLMVGIGQGMVNAPLTNTAVSGMPRSQAGVAAAITSTSRQVGQTLGVAVSGSIVGSVAAAGALGAGFARSTHPAWWLLSACTLAVLVLGVLSTTARARATAERAVTRVAEREAAPVG